MCCRNMRAMLQVAFCGWAARLEISGPGQWVEGFCGAEEVQDASSFGACRKVVVRGYVAGFR